MPTYLLAITCTVVVLCLNGCEEVHVENSLEQSLLLALLLSSKLSGRTCSSGRSESRCRRNASSGGKSDGVLHFWFNWWNYGTELVVFHAFTMFSLSLTVVLRQKRRTQIEDTLLKCVCLREWWWIISEPPLHSSTADPEVNKKTKKREREEKRQFSSRCHSRLFICHHDAPDRVLAKPPASHSNGRGNDFKEQVPMQIFLRHPSMSHMPHLQSTIQIELAYSTIIKHNKTITNTTKWPTESLKLSQSWVQPTRSRAQSEVSFILESISPKF